MNSKKAILKKYTGQGGIVGDTIREIPGTLKGMGKNLMKGKFLKAFDPGGIIPGVARRVGNTVANAMKTEDKMQKDKEAPYKQDLEDKMAGRERYNGPSSIENDTIKMYGDMQKRRKRLTGQN